MPIIGIEPALKPAQQLRRGGKALVMATPVTLGQEKFRRLYAMYGEDTLTLPCPGLMDMVERGILSGPELDGLLSRLLESVPLEEISVVVLGCTHYSFLSGAIAARFPAGTVVIDGNNGTARQLKRRLEENNLLAESGRRGHITLYSTSGEDGVLHRMEQLLHIS